VTAQGRVAEHERRLLELERRLRVIADFTYDWETWEDAGGRLCYISPACRRTTGYSAQEFLENPRLMADIILPEDREVWSTHRHLPRDPGTRDRATFRIVTREGETRWIEHACQAVSDKNGEFSGYRSSNRDITDRRRAEEALRRAELEKETILDSQLEHVIYQDLEHGILWPNRAACKSVGATREELIGRRCYEVWAGGERRCDDCPVAAAIETGKEHEVEKETPDGRAWYIRGYPVRNDDGEITGAIEVTQEITQRKELESQLLQSQKMEAVGILAGGVAHDFNNILTGIVGSAELALGNLERDSAATTRIEQIVALANRAAKLTRQLLAFSRQQSYEPKVVRFNELIGDLLGLLERLIGEDVELTFRPGASPDTIHADSGQIEQVLMNLCVNAKDAMPEGGKILIHTVNRTVEANSPEARSGLPSGPYVQLTVQDTGEGMDEQTRERAFEPFFTTKEVGKGTGLGLSTVYGIVRQHGGQVLIASQSGRGTAFHVLLPLTDAPVEEDDENAGGPARGGPETILLVEDEEAVRSVLEQGLETRGYRVLSAGGPERALEIFAENPGGIDLLITDVIMPEQSGFGLYRDLSASSPGLKVLFISGYSRKQVSGNDPRIADLPLLQKPFDIEGLARAARRVLDEEVI
jgi:PAS domain S-box-containing protein